VSGQWRAYQPNQHFGDFDIQQSGSQLNGRAEENNEYTGVGPAQLVGLIQGASIEFTVYWRSDSIGVYIGTISSAGRIEGTTFDKLWPNNRTSWFSSRQMNCLAREAAAPPPSPTKGLGKKKKIDPNAPDLLDEDGGVADVLKTSPVRTPLRRRAQNTATVNGDVDLYDAAAGEGAIERQRR
jgi:hypothetical protein